MTDWMSVFSDTTCPSRHEFVKHLADGSVWCPDCGEIVQGDTFNQDLPGILTDE